jgi:hypothetical protein
MGQSLPLRDIHLPETVGMWPPAIGWWLLLIVLPLLFLFAWWLFKRITKTTLTTEALAILDQIKNDPNSDQKQKLQQLSSWLRRIAISLAPRKEVASLSGQDWLHYLDKSIEGTPFSSGIGRYLADGHYQKSLPDNVDITALAELCENWLRRQQ